MKRILIVWLSVTCISGSMVQCQERHFKLEKQLPKELKEISGVAKDGDALWVIGDNSKSEVYKLDLSGNIIQTVHVTNVVFVNPEAITVDEQYVYVGDVGDNNGTRLERIITRILKSSLGKNKQANVRGEEIRFTFPDEGAVKKKKSNNYDCEAIMNYGDSIYLFTKRRDDDETELYVLPKNPGTFSARSMGTFKAKGLVTDATVNENGTSVALVGYDAGHTRPFIWIFSQFNGRDFFSGKHERYELTNEKKLDWQVESISYADDKSFYIACEKTRDVSSTLYLVLKKDLRAAKKE